MTFTEMALRAIAIPYWGYCPSCGHSIGIHYKDIRGCTGPGCTGDNRCKLQATEINGKWTMVAV